MKAPVLTFRFVAAVVVVLFLVSWLVWWWYFSAPAPVDTFTPAVESPEIRLTPKATITPPEVKVYAPKAKQQLDLPKEIQSDAGQHVIQSTRVSAEIRPQTVTTLIDERTGKVETIIRREPLPWLAFEHHGEVRIDVGFKNARRIERLTIREDLLQVKALHFGVHAALDSDGKYFYGAGVSWRW